MRKMKKEKTKVECVNIAIPKSIVEKIEKRIKQTDFDSVSSYVSYVLQEILSEDDEEEVVFSKEDEERVKERLRALGYLD